MAKSTAKPQVEGTSIDADIKEGKALGSIWRQTNSLKQTIKANGFDTRLGKLVQKLKAASSMDNGQISRQVLTTYGIYCIDRRRRSEALWFVENEKECREFIAKAKYKGSSLTALQAAMRKTAKGSEPQAEQPAKAEPSNVGQSDEAPEQPKAERPKITHKVMVNTIIAQAKLNDLDLEKIIEDLMEAVPADKAAA
tara:strand:- start:166 stop:753 length:588 start_codon:yes stop_codon:yes gene_type:complete